MVLWEPLGTWGAGGVHGRKVHLEIVGENREYSWGEELWMDLKPRGRNLGEGCRVGNSCRGAGGTQGTAGREPGEQHLCHFSFAPLHGMGPVGSLSAVSWWLQPPETQPGHSAEGVFADSTARRRFVEDFLVLVRGGASEEVTSLAHKDLPTAQLMQQWGDAVQYNPEIIKMKVLHPPLPPAPWRALCLNKQDLEKEKKKTNPGIAELGVQHSFWK